MITIANYTTDKFKINGVVNFKNFISQVNGDNIRIVNAYDSKLVLLNWTNYQDITVLNTVVNSVSELQTALLPIIYTRSSLNAGGGSVADGTFAGLNDVDLTGIQDGDSFRWDAVNGVVVPTSGLSGNNDNFFYIQFSVSTSITLSTDDWYTDSTTFRGKFNPNYTAYAALTDTNAFADDPIDKGFRHVVPYQCKLNNVFINVEHNGGSGDVEYAFGSYELNADQVNANFTTNAINRHILARKVLTAGTSTLHNYQLQAVEIDTNYIINAKSIIKFYPRRLAGASNIPLQGLNILLQFKKV